MSASCDERREYQKHTPYLPDRKGIDDKPINGIGYHRFGLDSGERYKSPARYTPVSKERREKLREDTDSLISLIDEYVQTGNSIMDTVKFNAFIQQKGKEIEEMAKKKETLPANVDLQGLNESQIAIVTQKTPKHLIKRRQGRGGKAFDYLPHGEVAKILNEAFNHAWSFETEPILQFCSDTEMTVKGVLTIYGTDGKSITKEQYGSQDIPKDRQGNRAISYGDALKGAASDSLKKCASLLGVALDLYANGHQYVNDPEPTEPVKVKPEPKEPPKTDPELLTDKQIELIQKLIKSHVFTTEERDKAISFCENPNSTKEKAVKFIDSLQSHIKTRKESEKDDLLKKVMKFRDDDPENFDRAMADFKNAYHSENAVTIEHFNHILSFQNGNCQQQAA